MSYAKGLWTGIAVSAIAGGLGWAALSWWQPASTLSTKGGSLPAPAAVPNQLKEDQLNTVTLTAEALTRLGLRTAAIERKSVARSRVYGGEITIPSGQSITVASPLSGTLREPANGVPKPGQAVKKGQPILRLAAMLTPEGRANLTNAKIEADGLVKSTQTQVEAAKIAFDRAKRLLQNEAGSQRAVEETQTQLDLAQRALEAATARRASLEKILAEVDADAAAPISIESPGDGVLRSLAALPNQNVPAGAPLFEVADLSRVWVRVPVYVGDLPELNAEAPSAVGNLAADVGGKTFAAAPVTAPPSANAAAGTVDLFYELDNQTPKFSPGQRVGVTLPLQAATDSLTAPWSAVIHDIYGGTWVYERTGERTFCRRRVLVRCVVDNTAVLAAGPEPGTQVVTAGAAELFGAETGFTK